MCITKRSATGKALRLIGVGCLDVTFDDYVAFAACSPAVPEIDGAQRLIPENRELYGHRFRPSPSAAREGGVHPNGVKYFRYRTFGTVVKVSF